LARLYSPSTIFFDEIDALMMNRGSSSEHESSRRLKSELLSQIDGIHSFENLNQNEKIESNNTTVVESMNEKEKELVESKNEKIKNESQIMILATTNKPWDLDEAMRRRLEKRIFIGLPDMKTRRAMFELFLKNQEMEEQISFDQLCEMSEGYSGADIHIICREGALRPLRREISNKSTEEILELKKEGKLKLA
jgi:katanin p60 ATPase-containing subunit A1